LVCGEGRLQAFKQLGQRTIPAIVLDVSDEDAFIMSLTENIARRKVSPIETVSTIMRLKSLGYSYDEIAAKVDLSKVYVSGITMLMEHGEERLVSAVEMGKIGLSNALMIFQAAGDDKVLQKAMHDAYENGSLRGKQFVQVRRLIERRARLGKDLNRSSARKTPAVTSQSLVKTYRTEVERQKYMVRKAESTQQRILLIVEAMRTLTADENFVTLLRAESLDTMPKFLFDRMMSTELRSS
jgi:ParB family chromosome partitioning protein